MKTTNISPWKIQMKWLCTSATYALVAPILVATAATISAAQTYTDLYNFKGTDTDLQDTLAQGRDGNLYGTTTMGGANNLGSVFKITPHGGLKVLYSFDGVHGSFPGGGLTLGTDGSFYSTAYEAGAHNCGEIFKITNTGRLTILYSFTGGADGCAPNAPPIQGADGNLYGTAAWTFYKITPAGAFTPLGSLPGFSASPPLQATDGNFYGTTYTGGDYGDGTVFQITPAGVVTVLYNFDAVHGKEPHSPLVEGSNGEFYGTTHSGLSTGCGVVFEVTPQGAITVLHNFDPRSGDGYDTFAGLLQATDGNFYGVTAAGGNSYCPWGVGCGVIFRIIPPSDYGILYNFDNYRGANPYSAMMQHTNGKMYGLAGYGGTSGLGVVYSFDTGLGPFISLVSTVGKVGKTFEVLGQGFSGATAVVINGTSAAFTVVSDTFLTATVPAGATSGPVTVTTQGGNLVSNRNFQVVP